MSESKDSARGLNLAVLGKSQDDNTIWVKLEYLEFKKCGNVSQSETTTTLKLMFWLLPLF